MKNMLIKSILSTFLIFFIYSLIDGLFICLNVDLLNLSFNVKDFTIINYFSYVIYIIIVYSLNGIVFIYLFINILLNYFMFLKSQKTINLLNTIIIYLMTFIGLSIIFDGNFLDSPDRFLNSIISLIVAVIFNFKLLNMRNFK